jgi:hypothetical protein
MGDALFNVRSTVVAREPWSLIDPDPTDRNMTSEPSISTKLWRPGFLYVTSVVQNHRIGVEQYVGAWGSRDRAPAPQRSDGKPESILAEVP